MQKIIKEVEYRYSQDLKDFSSEIRHDIIVSSLKWASAEYCYKKALDAIDSQMKLYGKTVKFAKPYEKNHELFRKHNAEYTIGYIYNYYYDQSHREEKINNSGEEIYKIISDLVDLQTKYIKPIAPLLLTFYLYNTYRIEANQNKSFEERKTDLKYDRNRRRNREKFAEEMFSYTSVKRGKLSEPYTHEKVKIACGFYEAPGYSNIAGIFRDLLVQMPHSNVTLSCLLLDTYTGITRRLVPDMPYHMHLPLGLRLHLAERDVYEQAIDCMELLISSLLEDPETCEYMLSKMVDLDCYEIEFICLLNNPFHLQDYIKRKYLLDCYDQNIGIELTRETLGKKEISIKNYVYEEVFPNDIDSPDTYDSINHPHIYIKDIFEEELLPAVKGKTNQEK